MLSPGKTHDSFILLLILILLLLFLLFARRVSALEEDLDTTETKMVLAVAKLDKASTAGDDAERAKKVFMNKAGDDDVRINTLERDLKNMREKAEAADQTYDVVAKKLQVFSPASPSMVATPSLDFILAAGL